MLIGIDMLAVQSPESGRRESGRLGRRLVSALLARDTVNRYVLYTHPGLPTDDIPSARNTLRVMLGGVSGVSPGPRAAIQHVLDHDPDGLDWLVLLDPFDPGYRGLPPESPLSDVKVASLIHDLGSTQGEDRRLGPIRGHDALIAASEAVAEECRRRLPSASGKVSRLGLAVDAPGRPELSGPLGVAAGEALGRLGIDRPFLLASLAAGAVRSNLGGILEMYHRLPLDLRERHQLVIAGQVDHPWAAVAYLHDHGCADGLVLTGGVDEPTLRSLYARCSAFVSPGFEGGSTLALVEAMACGSAVVAGRAGLQAEVLGGAGLLADPDHPEEIASRVAEVLTDVDLALDLRRKALARSAEFPWGPVIEGLLGVFRGEVASPSGGRSFRIDRSHVVRPRVALFASRDLVERLARPNLARYDFDLYFEPGNAAMVERLPIECGGFDARQFDRNDQILDYHAVVYLLPDAFALKANLGRLRSRPGLVTLRDEASLDRIGEGDNFEAEVACRRLRELFLTSSMLVVRSARNLEAIRSTFPEYADRVDILPEAGDDDGLALLAGLIEGCAAGLPRGSGRPRRARRSGLASLSRPTGPAMVAGEPEVGS